MGKTWDRLQEQLKTELKQDAEDCIKIYNHLIKTTGHVWSSQWNLLVETTFKGYPSDKRTFKPSALGYTLLKGISSK